jgi:dipeptidyl aminopeptidase/acylaminoacyl peptidase
MRTDAPKAQAAMSKPGRHACSVLLLFLCAGSPLGLPASEQRYERAPAAMRRVLDGMPAPSIAVGPDLRTVALAWPDRYRSIAEESRPFVRVAGLRVDPRSNALHRMQTYSRIAFQRIAGEAPFYTIVSTNTAERKLAMFRGSPDGRRIAVAVLEHDAVRLELVDLAERTTTVVPGVRLNPVLGVPFAWTADGRRLLARIVPARGAAPAVPPTPAGPRVEDASGRVVAPRTYEDLLQTTTDEARFAYYARSRLAYVDVATLAVHPVGPATLIVRAQPSPDGRYVLVETLHTPYSHTVPAAQFPRRTEIWDGRGGVAQVLGDLPSDETLPPDGVPTGPRAEAWRPNEPATLEWVERRDDGDALYALGAPFTSAPRTVATVERRFAGITWVERSGVALVQDLERTTHERRAFLLDETATPTMRLVFAHTDGRRYDDPGTFAQRRAPSGEFVLHRDGHDLFLIGAGAGADGRRPFVDRLDMRTLRTSRIFRSELQPIETPLALLDAHAGRFLESRASRTEPLQYAVRQGATVRAITAFRDEQPVLRGVERRFVAYERADGVALSFTLYLPPGYREGTKLPTLLWAYPLDFGDASSAGQNGDPQQTMLTVTGLSPVLLALRGYAVLDQVSMPVVGTSQTANDDFVAQISADAKAAVDEAVRIGVTDDRRVAVGGHSYGAFMTANLLAHTHLFRAGIALSGAYNRTLTPFGFQFERRTYWEARQTYDALSPFAFADKIEAPLLLVHGEQDENLVRFRFSRNVSSPRCAVTVAPPAW